MRTYTPTPRDIDRRWYVVDADGAVLGRLASVVAQVLRGKHKPIYAPHIDTGDHVIVVNAGKVRLTGGKENKKVEYRHSGYPGGLKERGYARLLAERPVHVVEKAVRGMLPKNRLGRAMGKKLSVYEGPEHPHAAQKPVTLVAGDVPAWSGLPARPEPKQASSPEGNGKTGAARSAGASKRSSAKRAPATPSTAKRRTTSEKAATAKRGAGSAPSARRTRATATTADQPPSRRTRPRRAPKEPS
jgi:large subunit ribosomal protein L13